MNEYILIFSGHVSKLLMSRKCKCTLIQMNRISKYEGLLFMFDLFRGFFKQFIIIIIEHHSFYYSWASLIGRTNDEYFSWSSGSFLLFFFPLIYLLKIWDWESIRKKKIKSWSRRNWQARKKQICLSSYWIKFSAQDVLIY